MGFAKKRPFLIALLIMLSAAIAGGKPFDISISDAVSEAVFSVLGYPVSAIDGFSRSGAKTAGKGKTGTAKLSAEAVAFAELKRENRRLKRLLKLAEKTPGKWIAATVAGTSPSPFSYKILILDKGEKDGIKEGMSVAAEIGGTGKTGGAVVGRILKSLRRNSQTLVITDPASSVDAFTQRTRARGVVKGRGNGCVMEYIDAQADIQTGDIVLSSGRDGVYPRSMIVGTVGRIHSGSGIKKAEVIPAADPYSLEEVIVIPGAPEEL